MSPVCPGIVDVAFSIFRSAHRRNAYREHSDTHQQTRSGSDEEAEDDTDALEHCRQDRDRPRDAPAPGLLPAFMVSMGPNHAQTFPRPCLSGRSAVPAIPVT